LKFLKRLNFTKKINNYNNDVCFFLAKNILKSSNESSVLSNNIVLYNLFFENNYIKKNLKIFKNFLLALRIKKKITFYDNFYISSKRKKNQTLIEKFITYLMRRGLKIKFTKIFNDSLRDFYKFFFFFNNQMSNDNKYYKPFLEIIIIFDNFFRFNDVLVFLVNLLQPFFGYKIEKVGKKYRKKLKKKFTGKIIHIKPKKRTSLVFKALLSYIHLFSLYKLSNRVSQSLFKTVIEQKNSYLYNRKIKTYAKIFKKLQKKVL
jgi:hypothetical protein